MNFTELSAILSKAANYLLSRKSHVAVAALAVLMTYDIGTGQYRQVILQIVAALAATGLQTSTTQGTT